MAVRQVWRWAVLALMIAGPAWAARNPPPQPVEPMGQPVTREDTSVGGVVGSPLEDLNLKHTDVPEVLLRSVANPYDMRGMQTCPGISAEIERLDAAIGIDTDEAPPPDDRGRMARTGATAGVVARVGVEAVTPYRGAVRFVTGATARAKALQKAIEAGFERRGYLKGLGMRMNCSPPAAPAWFKPTYAAAPLAAKRPPPRRK